MANTSKNKGDKGEVEFVKLMGGERTYHQPEKKGETNRKSDIVNVPYIGKGEIKRRKDSWKQLYDWIDGNDFVAFRSDRKKWIVAIRADDLKLILEEMDELKRAANK